ncbi:MAG TPA: hypothetical protein VF220_10480 [Nitrososphaeraceae archaeon]
MTRWWHYTQIAPTLVHFGVRQAQSNSNLGVATYSTASGRLLGTQNVF